MQSIKNFWNANFYTPREEDFEEKGYLTPSQFSIAGDQLTKVGWKWEKAINPKRQQKSLPDTNKQFLTIQGRSEQRIKDIMQQNSNQDIKVEGEWGVVDQSNEAQQKQGEDVTCRQYTISITYDEYYHCPRLWISGTDEEGRPLIDRQIFEDITSEHINETVTVEEHPHTGIKQLTIHPCKHPDRLKEFVQQAKEKGIQIKSTSSLLIFLKFMQSIMPTIEYDCTIDLDF